MFYSNTDETNGIIRLENALNDILGQYGEMLIFLTGDFNSRTASEPDFIKGDNLVGLAGNFYMGDSFDIERKSKDKIVNTFGISLLSMCKSFDIHVLNGRNSYDVNGEFTCETYNGRSVVDYFIASTSFFK